MNKRFACRLDRFRSQWQLSQHELARLLGAGSEDQISRVERGECAPSAEFLLGCEVAFGSTARELFPQLCDEVEERVVRNLYQWKEELEQDDSPSAKVKRSLIDTALSTAVVRAKQFEGYDS